MNADDYEAKIGDLIWTIEEMVKQNCDEEGPGVFHSGFIGIHAIAMDTLVHAGRAEYADGNILGKGRTIRFRAEEVQP